MLRNAWVYVTRKMRRTVIFLLILAVVLSCLYSCLNFLYTTNQLKSSLEKSSRSSLVVSKKDGGDFFRTEFDSLDGDYEITSKYKGLAKPKGLNVVEGAQTVMREDLPSEFRKVLAFEAVQDVKRHELFQSGAFTIEPGKVLLVVEDDRDNVQDATYTRDGVVDESAYNRNENYDDNRTIELSEEKLDVNTNEVQTGEVNVSKNVVEERESVDVPVEHEEVVIERHAVDGERESSHHDFKNEEFSIPVSEEQINVDKKSVVTEEVSIGKERVTEDKHVEETVRREELDIENTGDVNVNNSRNREGGYVEEDSLVNKDRYVEEDTLVDKDRLDKNDRF